MLKARYRELLSMWQASCEDSATKSQQSGLHTQQTPVRNQKRARSESVDSERPMSQAGDSLQEVLALTPASAAKLAQSCGKSPRPEMGYPDLTEEVVFITADPMAFVEDDLLPDASDAVREIYSHITDQCKITANPDYMPQRHHDQKWYKRVAAIR